MIKESLLSPKIPGTKLIVNRAETTAVVLPNDSVEIYSGGKNKPLHTLLLNPYSGKAVYENEKGEKISGNVEDMEKKPEIKEVLEEGKELLELRNYRLPPCESGNLRQWFLDLYSRKSISREELWDNLHEGIIVAEIWKYSGRIDPRPGDKQSMRADCLRLGKFVATDSDNWNICFFEQTKDPLLGSGVFLAEEDSGKIDVTQNEGKFQNCLVSGAEVVPLTKTDVEWLSRFVLFPVKRHLNTHKDLLALGSLGSCVETARISEKFAAQKKDVLFLGDVAL